MYIVIFRARVRSVDAEYARMAQRLRDLALQDFGCTAFHAVTEGQDEVALSYWPSTEAIRRWKAHPEHVLAQQLGRERWYESWSVEVARLERAYNSGPTSSALATHGEPP